MFIYTYSLNLRAFFGMGYFSENKITNKGQIVLWYTRLHKNYRWLIVLLNVYTINLQTTNNDKTVSKTLLLYYYIVVIVRYYIYILEIQHSTLWCSIHSFRIELIRIQIKVIIRYSVIKHDKGNIVVVFSFHCLKKLGTMTVALGSCIFWQGNQNHIFFPKTFSA